MDSSQSPEWFSGAPSATPSPRRPLMSRRMLVLIGVIVIMTIAAVSLAQIGSAHERTACLTTDNYKELTGAAISDDGFSPTTNFYGDTVTFTQNGTAYDPQTDTQIGGEALLKRVAAFYSQHDTTSIVVTVSGSYYAKTATQLTQTRINTVKASLIDLGVSGDDITTTSPVYVSSEDSTPSDPAVVHIALASRKACTISNQEDQ